MAFNVETFKTRALSALVFVIIMAVGLFFSKWLFFLLFSVIHLGCWYEYQKLIEKIDTGYTQRTDFHKYGVMITGWSFLLACCGFDMKIGEQSISVIGFWVLMISVVLLPIVETLFAKHINIKNIAHSAFGLFYISLGLGLLMDLTTTETWFEQPVGDINGVPSPVYNIPPFWLLPVFVIFCMWVNDTMAYIVGSFIGKTPLSKISPKKTWEGTLGGVILCIAVMGFAAKYFTDQYDNMRMNDIHWFVMAGIAAVAGVFGDLLESKLKRLALVKDSGNIMPGHGGFLDRFDSLLIAAPFVWLYMHFVVR